MLTGNSLTLLFGFNVSLSFDHIREIFKFLTAILVNISVSWDMTPCILLQNFGGAYCIHLQGNFFDLGDCCLHLMTNSLDGLGDGSRKSFGNLVTIIKRASYTIRQRTSIRMNFVVRTCQ